MTPGQLGARWTPRLPGRVLASLALAAALAACDGAVEGDGGAASGGQAAAAGAAGIGGTAGIGGAALAGSGGGGMAAAGAGQGGGTPGGSGGAGGSGGGNALLDAAVGVVDAAVADPSRDAGTGDAAVADAGPDAAGGDPGGGASCAGASYLVCEDFEDTAVGGTPQGWTKHGDASGVVDHTAHDSTRALELGAIPVWERRIYHDASALGAAHWGRIYFKVQLPVPDAFVHSTLVALSGVGPTRGASEYRVVDTVKQASDTPNVASRIQFLWNVQPQSSGEFGEGTSYDREFDDAWHCAEWHVDAGDQSYAFYLDGTELMSFAKGAGNYDGSDIPESFQELKVGWINYQDSPPGFTAWIDDVALDDERVGCL